MLIRNSDYTHKGLWLSRTCCVMVSVLASSVVDRGCEPRSGQTKDYEIDICCFFAKHVALMTKSKDCLNSYWDRYKFGCELILRDEFGVF